MEQGEVDVLLLKRADFKKGVYKIKRVEVAYILSKHRNFNKTKYYNFANNCTKNNKHESDNKKSQQAGPQIDYKVYFHYCWVL